MITTTADKKQRSASNDGHVVRLMVCWCAATGCLTDDPRAQLTVTFRLFSFFVFCFYHFIFPSHYADPIYRLSPSIVLIIYFSLQSLAPCILSSLALSISQFPRSFLVPLFSPDAVFAKLAYSSPLYFRCIRRCLSHYTHNPPLFALFFFRRL